MTTNHQQLYSYGSAAVRALGYYALVYILVIHLLVAWKWQTTELEDLLEIEYYNVPVLPDVPVLEGLPTRKNVDQLVEDIQQSQTKRRSSSQVKTVLDEYHAKLREWDSNTTTAIVDAPLLPQGRKSIKIVSFVKLLLQASLSELEEEDGFNNSLQMALREFQGLADHKDDVQWNVIANLLLVPTPDDDTTQFPDKEKLSEEDLYDMVCQLATNITLQEDNETLVVTDSSADIDVDLSLYVEENDLKVHDQILRDILEGRDENIKDYLLHSSIKLTVAAALKESLDIVQQDLTDAQAFTDETLEDYQMRVKENQQGATDAAQCVAQEDLEALLDEGLRTLMRRGDLRAALLEKLKELDPPAAENLILDAVLDTQVPIPKEHVLETINVGRLIDTPILRYMKDSIDAIFRWTRLHTNKLDLYFEYLDLKAKLGDQLEVGTSSQGEILVLWLLQLTGKIEIPVVTPLRRLLLRSETTRGMITY